MKISDVFDVKYGVNLELNGCERTTNDDSKGINFVSRTSYNNGVVAKVKPIPGIIPQPAGILTCAGGGSVLSTFVQTSPFYSGRDLYILVPKIELTFNEKIYYALCIKHNAYRYGYGRQANKTLRDLELPDSIPVWVNREHIEIPATNNKLSEVDLHVEEWKQYNVSDLFDICRGKRLIKTDRIPGTTPLVTAGFLDDGVAEFISNDGLIEYRDCLTVDMFGNCHYRGYPFHCDDNILVLACKTDISKYAYLFLATIISMDRYRYSYGRQYRQKDVNRHVIRLPTTNGEPDWNYMESLIKALPYGDLI